MMQKISLNIDTKSLNELDRFATLRGTTRSKVIRALMREWIGAHGLLEIDTIVCESLPQVQNASSAANRLLSIPFDADDAVQVLWMTNQNNS